MAEPTGWVCKGCLATRSHPERARRRRLGITRLGPRGREETRARGCRRVHRPMSRKRSGPDRALGYPRPAVPAIPSGSARSIGCHRRRDSAREVRAGTGAATLVGGNGDSAYSRGARSSCRPRGGRAKAKTTATWRTVDSEGSPARLYFRDADTLVVDGRAPRAIQLSTGSKTRLSETDIVPPARDPEGRYAVRDGTSNLRRIRSRGGSHWQQADSPRSDRSARWTMSPARLRSIVRRRYSSGPCSVGRRKDWSPRREICCESFRSMRLRKPAGRPIDLSAGSPLPAPIRGARITTDGSRYVIPHAEGIVVRDWQGRRSRAMVTTGRLERRPWRAPEYRDQPGWAAGRRAKRQRDQTPELVASTGYDDTSAMV